MTNPMLCYVNPSIVQYCTVLYCSVLYCTVLYSILIDNTRYDVKSLSHRRRWPSTLHVHTHMRTTFKRQAYFGVPTV